MLDHNSAKLASVECDRQIQNEELDILFMDGEDGNEDNGGGGGNENDGGNADGGDGGNWMAMSGDEAGGQEARK